MPSIGAWDGFGGSFANLALFGLTAVGGTWVVHQVEYAIEYRERFAAVMGDAPHRLYMGPVGGGLLVAALSLLALLMLFFIYAEGLRRAASRRGSYGYRIPARSPMRPSFAGWLTTGMALAALQTALYTAQENLESAGWFGIWPGWEVLVAPRHATVLPLHFLIAMCLSLVLWVGATVLHRSRRVVRWARMVEALLLPRHYAPSIEVIHAYRPDRRGVDAVLAARPPPCARTAIAA